MTSIGHQTGLFDAMARCRRLTSEEIAKAAGLDSATCASGSAGCTGGVVDYDAEAGRTPAARARRVR